MDSRTKQIVTIIGFVVCLGILGYLAIADGDEAAKGAIIAVLSGISTMMFGPKVGAVAKKIMPSRAPSEPETPEVPQGRCEWVESDT